VTKGIGVRGARSPTASGAAYFVALARVKLECVGKFPQFSSAV